MEDVHIRHRFRGLIEEAVYLSLRLLEVLGLCLTFLLSLLLCSGVLLNRCNVLLDFTPYHIGNAFGIDTTSGQAQLRDINAAKRGTRKQVLEHRNRVGLGLLIVLRRFDKLFVRKLKRIHSLQLGSGFSEGFFKPETNLDCSVEFAPFCLHRVLNVSCSSLDIVRGLLVYTLIYASF